jgi:hypothetical protein
MKTWNLECDKARDSLAILHINPTLSTQLIMELGHDGQSANDLVLLVLDVTKAAHIPTLARKGSDLLSLWSAGTTAEQTKAKTRAIASEFDAYGLPIVAAIAILALLFGCVLAFHLI